MKVTVNTEELVLRSIEFWSDLNCWPIFVNSEEKLLVKSESIYTLSLARLHFGDAIQLYVNIELYEDLCLKAKSHLEENLIIAELDENRTNIENSNDGSEVLPVIRLVESIINQGIIETCTDIHFEPDENSIKVRFRVDGMLRVHQILPEWVRAALVSRLKILGALNIAEKRIPQDGRIGWLYKSESLDVRISSLPTKYGEKIVLRILRQTESISSLDQLGLAPEFLNKLELLFKKPQGIIYVTGPTGSGKSSTLYAGLRSIANDSLNITTIEDPIEYELSGANQVQINDKAGLSFSKALRSILRQDPDVILVGETRDLETASISMQAAQTGHLVLSTLHTNDSIGAINRLRDLGVASYLISSSVLCVVAQRLVRRLCSKCKEQRSVSVEILKCYDGLPELAYFPKGCIECDESGYQGRIAIFELLEVDEKIREAILEEANPDKIKRSSGWSALVVDGINKVKSGITSPDELVRVIGF